MLCFYPAPKVQESPLFGHANLDFEVDTNAYDGRMEKRIWRNLGKTVFSKEKNDVVNAIKLHDHVTDNESMSFSSSDADHDIKKMLSIGGDVADYAEELKNKLDDLYKYIGLLESRCQNNSKEITELLGIVSDREKTIREIVDNLNWCRQVIISLASAYKKSIRNLIYWMLPSFFTMRRQMRMLKRKKLFDVDHYIASYPDVAAAGTHPLRHYVDHGFREGRLSGRVSHFPDIITEELVDKIRKWEHFDANWYAQEYPDIHAVGMEPAYHYLWIGAKMGRSPSSGFVRIPNHLLTMAEVIREVDQGYFDSRNVFTGVSYVDNAGEAAEFIQPGSVDLTVVKGLRVGIHAHMYYDDLAEEFALYLARMPCHFDLYVSARNEDARLHLISIFSAIPNVGLVDVRVTPNIGRDIAPFLVEFGKDLARYDIIAHIQTKKSLYNNGSTDGWREYILSSLFKGSNAIAHYLGLLQSGRYGIIYPQCFYNLPYMANTWLANGGIARAWASRFGVDALPDGYFDFPAGSMFWASADALRPLLEAGLGWDNFPAETGQTDGTLAHCIERMLGVVPTARQYQHGVIRDNQTPSWSRWRLNQFIDRPLEHMHAAIADPRTKVVAFDIFDTLITRPLLDPDYVKHLLDEEHSKAGLKGFHTLRGTSEEAARQAKGLDVDIHEIYRHFPAAAPGFAPTANREIELEIRSVRARPQAIDLLRFALDAGKRVILASDMFLPRSAIEAMLERCGAMGWDKLYLSCEIGVRKDSGRLYGYILETEKIVPDEMVMIGDNERSDFQIPADMGIRTIHLVRSSHIMRAMPRLAGLIPLADAPLGDQFLFGAIAARNFSAISYPHFAPADMFGPSASAIGYGLLGPIVVAFSQWLTDQAREGCIERLYFLSREGKFLKQAFDCWQEALPEKIDSHYLLVSRRAITVPCIHTIEDIFHIAASNDFYGASMDLFLKERFGTTLTDVVWAEAEHKDFWTCTTPLTISQGNITHIAPFLRFVSPQIFAQADAERETALRYFSANGFEVEDQARRVAVVDVGYSGTIQRHLIKLLERDVHGLYMMTDVKGEALKKVDGVLAEGCFAQGVNRDPSAPPMFLHSFLLEKMLSADDEQVICFAADGTAEFREQGAYPAQAKATRSDMQQGALDFIRDAARFRDEMGVSLQLDKGHCQELYARFVAQLSPAEKKVFANLALDDFYCGRGIVIE